jgi:RecB family endonuclease NucS
MSIGKIERVPLRQVWRHEALDFTTWLEQNIDALSEVLDLSLSSAEREQSAGDFSVDIVAEDGSGNTVIIENQLEQSDHDHLGKLVTYVSMLEAKAAIWIVAAPRPEHVRAVAWLNEGSSAAFYLVKL